MKRLDNGETFSYQAERPWYLASSSKLPVAIAMLQEVEAGKHRLDETLVLQQTDKVDGSGNMVWQPAGTVRRLDALMERMLMVSDNTAANMLVRTLGEATLNQRAREMLGEKDVTLTNFTQVRYDVYAELDPAARKLSNLQLVQIAAAPMGPKRVDAVARTLGVSNKALKLATIDEAYARYYARHLNEASLQAYGGMLEKLVRGQLLSPAHTQLLFKNLKYDSYDAYRLEAGLPRTVRFIHKTGTQFGRACHMGVIEPQDGARRGIVVATCTEGMDENQLAGDLFERLGRAITQHLLAPAGAAGNASAGSGPTLVKAAKPTGM